MKRSNKEKVFNIVTILLDSQPSSIIDILDSIYDVTELLKLKDLPAAELDEIYDHVLREYYFAFGLI